MESKIIQAAIVVGARPNFMKAAPIIHAMQSPRWRDRFHPILIHTGQHYDFSMSDIFWRDLDLPKPDIYLGIGSMEREKQIAAISEALIPRLKDIAPDVVIVVGDVNSSLGAANAARACGIRLAHVEAGLRSFDETMPEEINRKAIDEISDLLFTTEESANRNLEKEGIKGAVHFVGNTMIDSLVHNRDRIDESAILKTHGVRPGEYAVITLHRPSNVDNPENLEKILRQGFRISKTAVGTSDAQFKFIFPLHPRTKEKIEGNPAFSALLQDEAFNNIVFVEPLGYIDFIKLVKNASFVMTDSGGIQEETTYLGVPCLTLRNTTERPVTAQVGTNTLIEPDQPDFLSRLKAEIKKIREGRGRKGGIPDRWDGKSAERIAEILSHI